MEIGYRVIFNPTTGTVLNNTLGEMSGQIQTDLRPETIEFIDLPYGYDENNFRTATRYHIDVNTRQIVVDEYYDIETGQFVVSNPFN